MIEVFLYVYENRKMKPVEIVQRIWGRRVREWQRR
jgi:hypothetical protein